MATILLLVAGFLALASVVALVSLALDDTHPTVNEFGEWEQ